MKIVGLCGVPGTGKTTIMRELMEGYTYNIVKHGTLEYMACYNNTNRPFVLGKYTGDMFDGTDKLSMAVINDAEGWLSQNNRPDVHVLFEGDRLWCPRFVNFIINELKAEFFFIYVLIDTPTLVKRHTERAAVGQRQDTKFIVSRHTKYKNLIGMFPGIFQKRTNNNHCDLIKIVEEIQLFLET
jgi:adenylate kinase